MNKKYKLEPFVLLISSSDPSPAIPLAIYIPETLYPGELLLDELVNTGYCFYAPTGHTTSKLFVCFDYYHLEKAANEVLGINKDYSIEEEKASDIISLKLESIKDMLPALHSDIVKYQSQNS